MADFGAIQARIDLALTHDRPHLRQLLSRIRQAARQRKPHDRNLARLTHDLDRSVQLADARRRQRPRPDFAPPDRPDLADLPILQKRDEIASLIRDHPVTIICGETGSGKTTQLPKIALDLGRGAAGLIGHTQPRRLAARALAARIADELGAPLGREVGYQVRFTDKTSDATFVKVMTDGILLNEVAHDRLLSRYDTIILDEAHERSLNIDLLLGLLKRILDRRSDLKLIITSATIDPQSFSDFFNNAPILNVSGRTYPVEVRYRPLAPEADNDDDAAEKLSVVDEDLLQRGVRDAIDELIQEDRTHNRTPGDMLVFLPTERDILETAKRLRGRHDAQTDVLPLYARLTPQEQQKIFQPHSRRRIVLATNVAETSLTVPGIRYVIDTGLARVSRYSARAKVQRLPIESVSQASANQRKGRCGRQEAGVCIRLFGEQDFNQRDAFTQPEIQRSNLAGVLLNMMGMGLGDVRDFPFIDPPRPAMLTDAYRTLHELGAVTDDGKLTAVGRKLTALPTDPRIGRMLIAGCDANCLAEVLIIASALEIQDPRVRPPEEQNKADAAHEQFDDPRSDFLSLVKLWDFYHQLKQKLSHRKLQLACRENYLSLQRLREWAEVHRQLAQLLRESDVRMGTRGDLGDEQRVSAVHQALLTGLLSHVAMKTATYEYDGASGKKLMLWPGSGQFDRKPLWIMSAEQVETTQRYARVVAPVNPKWIEPAAKHLLSRSVSEPHWDRPSAHVMAFEKLTLYGLPVVLRRRCNFGSHDPAKARELFILHALVEGEFDTEAPFFAHNAAVVEEVRAIEAKARRRDLLVDPQVIFAFYDRRIPANVCDGPSFEKWRRDAVRHNAKLLFLSRDDLMQQGAADVTAHAYPDALRIGQAELKLEYHLEPGDERDGVTVICPLAMLNQLEQRRLAWLTPGLLAEKLTAMIRALPKELRKAFVPAPDVAEELAAALRFDEGVLAEAAATALSQRGETQVKSSDFQLKGKHELPRHLRMNVRVIDDAGRTLGEGRDLHELRQTLRPQLTQAIAASADDSARWSRTGEKRWTFGDLPASVKLEQGEWNVQAYPALIDEGETVGLKLFDSEDHAAAAHRQGVARLYELATRDELKYRLESDASWRRLALLYAPHGGAASLRRQLSTLVAERAFVQGRTPARSEGAFEHALNAGWPRLGGETTAMVQQVTRVLEALHSATRQLDQLERVATFDAARRDVEQQLKAMTQADFLTRTPGDVLPHLPRYFKAIEVRLSKLRNGGVTKDAKWMSEFAGVLAPFAALWREQQARGELGAGCVELRWALEELRVSLFAQSLGTSRPVSPAKLREEIEKVRGQLGL